MAIAVGALVGLINGLLIAVIGIPSIITTLATLYVFEGLSIIIGAGVVTPDTIKELIPLIKAEIR